MTRKFTLFLASMLIVFSAGATMPMTNITSCEQQDVTSVVEESEDEGFWWGGSFDLPLTTYGEVSTNHIVVVIAICSTHLCSQAYRLAMVSSM